MSLKDRKHSVDLYSLLGIQSVSDVVRPLRRGRVRWIEHLGFRGGIGRLGESVWMMTWKCFLHPEWAVLRDM